MPEDLLAFRLLKAANLSKADHKLARGTATLEYNKMRDQLKRLFSEKNFTENNDTVEEINLQEQSQTHETYYSRGRPYYRGRVGQYQPRSDRSNWRSNSTSYAPPNNKPFPTASQQIPQSPRGHPQHRSERKASVNPINARGNISSCAICRSIMHWAEQCPHKSQSTYLSTDNQEHSTNEELSIGIIYEAECDIILFQSDFDSPAQITGILSESFNNAVIDCGASKTVCGQQWFDVLLQSLPDHLTEKILYQPSNRMFKF